MSPSPGSGLSTSNFISASLTFASPLITSLSNVDESGSVLAWFITDGVHSASSGTNTLSYLFVSTDASGNIVQNWAFKALTGTGATLSTVDCASSGPLSPTCPVFTPVPSADSYIGTGGVPPPSAVVAANDTGWNTSAAVAPEPAGVVLAGPDITVVWPALPGVGYSRLSFLSKFA